MLLHHDVAHNETGSVPLRCTCAFTDMKDGSKFFTIRDRACPEHGDDKQDWRSILPPVLPGELDDPNPLWTDWKYYPTGDPHLSGPAGRSLR